MRGLVLLLDRGDLSRIIYHALAEEFSIKAVVREARASRSSFLRRRLQKLGWRTVLGQIAFTSCIVPLLKRESSRRRADILRQYGLDVTPIPRDRIIDVNSINDVEVLDLLRELSPEIIVVNGTRILDEKLLNATGGLFLNTHVGITPLYRGVHGGYWALASGDPAHFGITVHKIDKGIDSGDILARGVIQPSDADNFSTYPLLQVAIAIPLLKQVVHDALNGRLETMPAPDGQSRLWSHPTAFQYLRHRIMKGVQ